MAIHAGYSSKPTTKAVAVPIYQATAYAFENSQCGADLFDLKIEGNIYTRIMNPTQGIIEVQVAAMEGGIASLALPSGQHHSPQVLARGTREHQCDRRYGSSVDKPREYRRHQGRFGPGAGRGRLDPTSPAHEGGASVARAGGFSKAITDSGAPFGVPEVEDGATGPARPLPGCGA